jgi:hypothetical protein
MFLDSLLLCEYSRSFATANTDDDVVVVDPSRGSDRSGSSSSNGSDDSNGHDGSRLENLDWFTATVMSLPQSASKHWEWTAVPRGFRSALWASVAVNVVLAIDLYQWYTLSEEDALEFQRRRMAEALKKMAEQKRAELRQEAVCAGNVAGLSAEKLRELAEEAQQVEAELIETERVRAAELKRQQHDRRQQDLRRRHITKHLVRALEEKAKEEVKRAAEEERRHRQESDAADTHKIMVTHHYD